MVQCPQISAAPFLESALWCDHPGSGALGARDSWADRAHRPGL